MEKKQCVLYEGRLCTDCGECLRCDLDPTKICDNCMKCVNSDGAEYRAIEITGIEISGTQRAMNNSHKNH